MLLHELFSSLFLLSYAHYGLKSSPIQKTSANVEALSAICALCTINPFATMRFSTLCLKENAHFLHLK